MKKLIIILCFITITPLFSFQSPDKSSIKVALILDTSNSMDGLIDQAKSQLWSVVNELSNAKKDGITPNLEIALYEYGNDKLPMREGYIRLVTPFTNDLDLISEKLFALRTDGGSEYCGKVIGASLKALDWEDYPNDLKMIFIAGNEGFNQGNVNYREVCKSANKKDITINTIFCGNFKEGKNTHWKNGADIGGGEYMNIDQDINYVIKKSPYDDKILILNDELNKTYLNYGIKGASLQSRQLEQDKNAFFMSESVAVERVATKSKSNYKNTQWDLVDASDKSDFNINDIDNNNLPKEMKNMSAEEKVQYIELKKQERNTINKEIVELTQKRNKYLTEESDESAGNMLDKAIINATKKQAIAKNYQFEE